MKCSQCGRSNAEDVIECESCGELLVDVFETANKSPQSSGQSRQDADHSPVSSEEIQPGFLIGNRYEILELIGEGGMGRVFKVHDKELEKTVALKLIRMEQAVDPVNIQRFKQELLLARQITHKNVVRIYDFGEASGFKFFTMEWIDGENLRERIRRDGKLPLEESLPVIRQMLEGLQEAHNEGVVHRDLKPHNVMIDREGSPHIMDFGIARAADTNTMTATGSVIGTPDYMSPEQACGEKAGPQSDLYSLGVILYEMLTGELPFQADSPLSRVVMRLTKKPTTPRELNGELPEYLERIVLKCLEVEQNLRYQSAEDILRDLEREHVDRSFGLKIRLAAGRYKTALLVTASLIIVSAVGLYALGRWRSSEATPPPDVPVTTLAILPFANATGSSDLEWLREGLPEMLFTDISQSRYIRPVATERIASLLGELGVEGQSRLHETTLDSIAERAPADSVLYGQFVGSEGRLRLDLTLRSAETGVPLHLKVEEDADQVFRLVDQITRRVKEQLDLTPEQLRGDTDHPIAEVSTASLEALRAYEAGLAQLRQGSNQNAVPLLENATNHDPQFAMALAKLAEAYVNLGQHTKATGVIDKAREISEASPLPLVERHYIHAIAAIVKDDLETAIESYEELAKLYPKDPDVQLSLAQSLERLGRTSEALDTYQKVLSLVPGNGAALLGLGRSQAILGRGDEAIVSLQETLDTGEFDDDLESMGMIHSIMGVAHRDTGKLDEAIVHLKLSLDFRRRSGDIRGQSATLTNLAAVYEHRGEIKEALDAEYEALELARQIGDRHAESLALLNIGLTNKAGGDLDGALEALRESMRIEMDRQDRNNLPTRLNYIADIYRIRGQYDDALVYLEQAKGLFADSGSTHEKAMNLEIIGLVKKSQGVYDEAIEAFLEALSNYQEVGVVMGVASTQTSLSEIYAEQGRFADANRASSQSLEIYQDLDSRLGLAESNARLGDFYLTLGQLEEGKKHLDRAWIAAEDGGSDDVSPLIRTLKGRLLRLSGSLKAAEEELSHAHQVSTQQGQRELSYRSRIELGRTYLDMGETSKAEQHLREALEEASRSGLRSIEAAAGSYLAKVYLLQGNPQAACDIALDSLEIAQSYSGRPLIFTTHATLGEACGALGRETEVQQHYSEAVATLSRIQEELNEEQVASYMAQPEVRAILEKTLDVMESTGRTGDIEPIRKWLSTKK